MIAERWRQVESLFHQVVSLPPRDRESLLASACADDADLRRQVDSLLVHAEGGAYAVPHAVGQALADLAAIPAMDPTGAVDCSESFTHAADTHLDSGSPALPPGIRIGEYELIGLIGAGGMGEVYRALDSRLHREVAIKVLPSFVSTNPDRLRRFEQEARAAAALNHPNILVVFQMGSHAGAPYLVSELLHGHTLRHPLESGPLELAQALDYALQICAGLQAAHAKGIVHRDLKPENVFITKEGRVKILDFGLAKLLQPQSALSEKADGTAPGAIMGTLGYMSPEQLRGQTTDGRADIFAFGAILFEMMTGRRAFTGGSSADVIGAILHHHPVLAETGKTSLSPPALKSLIGRCLEKDPDARFGAVADLVHALEAVRARTLEAPIHDRPMYRRRGYAYAALVLVVLAAVLSLLFFKGAFAPGSSKGNKISSIAVLPLANLSGDSSQDYFADGMTESLITDLAQAGVPRVISHTSVMGYKGGHKSLPQIAKELNVDGIVEGSVTRAANRVRITAQLIYAPEDKHVWAATFDRNLSDVLSIETEVAQSIATAVQVRIMNAGTTTPAKPRRIDPEAHDDYLRGRYFWNLRTEEGLQKAERCFKDAIAKDPAFAPAYSGLADTYFYLGYAWGHMPPKDAMPLARANAQKALALDSNSAEGHSSLGFVEFVYDWNFRDAEKELKHAIALDPNYSMAHHVYSVLLAATGRAREGVNETRKAVEVDPLSIPSRNMLSEMLCNDNRVDEAMREVRKTFELDPNAIHAGMLHRTLSSCYKRKGMPKEAFEEELKALTADGVPTLDIAAIRKLHERYGDEGTGRRYLQSALDGYRKSQWHWDALTVARLYGDLHEYDHAFQWLNKAADLRSTALFWLYVGDDPLTADPRFRNIERKMGLIR